jgi:hypothetical protein
VHYRLTLQKGISHFLHNNMSTGSLLDKSTENRILKERLRILEDKHEKEKKDLNKKIKHQHNRIAKVVAERDELISSKSSLNYTINIKYENTVNIRYNHNAPQELWDDAVEAISKAQELMLVKELSNQLQEQLATFKKSLKETNSTMVANVTNTNMVSIESQEDEAGPAELINSENQIAKQTDEICVQTNVEASEMCVQTDIEEIIDITHANNNAPNAPSTRDVAIQSEQICIENTDNRSNELEKALTTERRLSRNLFKKLTEMERVKELEDDKHDFRHFPHTYSETKIESVDVEALTPEPVTQEAKKKARLKAFLKKLFPLGQGFRPRRNTL